MGEMGDKPEYQGIQRFFQWGTLGRQWPTALFYALVNYHFLLNICARLKIELCSFGFEEMAGCLTPNERREKANIC